MDPKVKRLVDQVEAFLHERYSDGIKRVILYGSHARGEAKEDSDIDVLVLTNASLDPSEARDSLSDLLYDIILEEGELVSVVAIPEDRYENYNSPFVLNVKKEGMVV